jgi:hypothetical protein
MIPKPTRLQKIDNRTLAVFDEILTDEDQAAIAKLFRTGTHSRMPSSLRHPEMTHLGTVMDPGALTGTSLLAKLEEIVRTYFDNKVSKVARAYSTSSNYGEITYIHQDVDGKLLGATAVVFLNPEWKEEWAGELTFFDDTKDAVASVTPKPFRLVISHSNVFHRQGIPSRDFYGTRHTLVINLELEKKVP